MGLNGVLPIWIEIALIVDIWFHMLVFASNDSSIYLKKKGFS